MNADMTNIFINNEPIFVDELTTVLDNYKVFDLDKTIDSVRIIDGFELRMIIDIEPISKLFFTCEQKRIVIKNDNHPIFISYTNKIVVINTTLKTLDITIIQEPRVQYTRPFVMFNRQYGENTRRNVYTECKRETPYDAPFDDLYVYIKNHVPVYIRSHYTRFRPLFPEMIDKIVKFVEAYESENVKSIEYNGRSYNLNGINFIHGRVILIIKNNEFESVPIEKLITGEMTVTYNDEEE